MPVNLGLLNLSPEAPQSTTANPWTEESGAQLLELRTRAGTLYVCPSRWQRIRLQWVFRHFHELPLQVLSRRDQRLIEKLSQSAVATPASPVTGTALLGVVENLNPKPSASVARVVTMRPQSVPAKPFHPTPWTPALLKPDFSQRRQEKEIKQIFGTAKSRDVRDVPFRQWGALTALCAACATVIVASFFGIPLVPGTETVDHPRPLPASAQASHSIKPPVAFTPAYFSPPIWLPTVKAKHQGAAPELSLPHNEFATLENGPKQPVSAKTPPIAFLTPISDADSITAQAPAASASTAAPLVVSELPQSHFVHPVVSEPNLVGELQLKALIGADGLVKQVTVLSGNPKLAEVGMRAVRQWHYAPYQVLGNPVEVETQIKMNFFGEDAVSVASVATGPPASSRVASVPPARDQALSSKPND
jgi:hypothetical protein